MVLTLKGSREEAIIEHDAHFTIRVPLLCPGQPALRSSLWAHLFGNSRPQGQVYTCNLGELIPPVDAELPAALLE